MNKYLIDGEDFTYLPNVFNMWWLWKQNLFSDNIKVYYKNVRGSLGYPVFLDGRGMTDTEERALATLYFLFKNFKKVVGRFPRVYRLGPKGGLKKLKPEDVDLDPKTLTPLNKIK